MLARRMGSLAATRADAVPLGTPRYPSSTWLRDCCAEISLKTTFVSQAVTTVSLYPSKFPLSKFLGAAALRAEWIVQMCCVYLSLINIKSIVSKRRDVATTQYGGLYRYIDIIAVKMIYE